MFIYWINLVFVGDNCCRETIAIDSQGRRIGIFYCFRILSFDQLIQRIFPYSFAGCRLFTLDSVNVCRKYSFLFDLLLSISLSNHWCILSWRDFRRVQKAMHAHSSQMVWFRRLYIIFSRYMVINTLREIQLSDAELEMQIDSLQKAN